MMNNFYIEHVYIRNGYTRDDIHLIQRMIYLTQKKCIIWKNQEY